MSPELASTSPCPRCGVAVPNGYVKCPRCHSAMPPPQARARRESMREQLVAGGTAVPEPEGGGFPWLLAGVCAAAAITAIVWYVQSGGAKAAEPAPVSTTASLGSAALAAGTPVDRGVEAPPPVAPAVDPRPRQRTEAIDALARALASDQLWATVTAVGDGVEIRSGFCADPGVAARVHAVEDRLGALGFRAVRCLEKGGAPVWRQDLP